MLKNYLIPLSLTMLILTTVCQNSFSQNDTVINKEEFNIMLLLRVYNGDLDGVIRSVEKGASVDASDYQSTNALMYALLGGRVEIINYLLDKNAEVNVADMNGVSVLMYGARQEEDGVFERIIDRVEDVNVQCQKGETALIYVSQTDKIEYAQLLIDKGALVNLADNEGVTPLMHACAFGRFFMADFFIFYGADVNQNAADGSTALHLAAWYGNNEISGLLIESGAEIDAADNKGNTPLMAAIMAKNYESSWYFTESGARLDIRNNNDFTPLSLAIANNDTDIVNLITYYEFTEPTPVSKRKSPLALAYYNRNIQITKELRKFGGFKPKGLYILEYFADTGFEFNREDFMYSFSGGVIESRSRILARVGFAKRTTPRIANVAQSETLIHRYRENRSVLSLSLQREIRFFRKNYHEFGSLLGVKGIYSYGSYNGTLKKPPVKIIASPAVDIYYKYDWICFFGGYTFFRTGISEIPSNRFHAGLRFIIPVYSRSQYNYSPAIQ